MALRRVSPTSKISLWARREQAVEGARRALPDCDATTSLEEAVNGASLAVLCPTPHAIEQILPALPSLLPEACVVTDAGSVKARIVATGEAALGGRFVGSHPMAGSEKSGLAAARGDLFQRAACILTPTSRTNPEAMEAVRDLWRSVGCSLHELSPSDHDHILARISHLPHATAAALVHVASGSGDAVAVLAGNGYRDTTRIAGGPPLMWAEILLDNAGEVIAGIHDLQLDLGKLKTALEQRDRAAVESFLATAAQRRALQSKNP